MFSYEKISTRFHFACIPELAVGNFAPTCCDPAFGKARLAIIKYCLVCFSLLLMGIWRRMLIFPECYPCLFAIWWFTANC